MVARKETPDILADVLGSKPLGNVNTDSINTSKPVNRNYGKPAKKHTEATANIEADEDADKVKVTFYISAHAVESLENTWLSLRKLVKPRSRRSASKSRIVEEAIQMAAKDVADKGERSQFVNTLFKG